MFEPRAIGGEPLIDRPFRMAKFSREFRKKPVIAAADQHGSIRCVKRLIRCQVGMARGVAFRQLAHIHIDADFLPRPQKRCFEQGCIHHAALARAVAPFQHGERAEHGPKPRPLIHDRRTHAHRRPIRFAGDGRKAAKCL